MIKRLHSRKSHGTLVANPRRKKRNGAKRRRRTSRKLSALAMNPGGRRRKRSKVKNGSKLSHYFARKGRKAYRRRRNPEGAPIDIVSIGVGSLVAIAAGAVGQAIFNTYLDDKIENTALREATPSLIVAAGAFAAHKYMSSPKVKQVAKITMMLAVFKALDKSVGGTIEQAVGGILPGGGESKSSMGGGSSYIKATKGYLPVTRGTAGAFVTPTGGAYAQLNGLLPGAGLYGL